MAEIVKLQYNGRTILNPNRNAYVGFIEPEPVEPIINKLAICTYCQRVNTIDTSLSRTNIRYYEKGVAKEAGYSDNPTRLSICDMNTSFGVFKGVYTTSRYAPGNWTTSQMNIPLTTDMANALIDDGLQLECVFRLRNTNAHSASTNYARYIPINMGYMPSLFCWGISYGWKSDRPGMNGGLINNVSWQTVTNNFSTTTSSGNKLFLPTNSTLGTTAHHLAITTSKKNGYIRVWLDGVLSAYGTGSISDSDSTILGKVGQTFHGWQMANEANLEISQIVYRDAIWTESINYTPPTEPYLAVADYY